MNHPRFIVSTQKEEFISKQRVEKVLRVVRILVIKRQLYFLFSYYRCTDRVCWYSRGQVLQLQETDSGLWWEWYKLGKNFPLTDILLIYESHYTKPVLGICDKVRLKVVC